MRVEKSADKNGPGHIDSFFEMARAMAQEKDRTISELIMGRDNEKTEKEEKEDTLLARISSLSPSMTGPPYDSKFFGPTSEFADSNTPNTKAMYGLTSNTKLVDTFNDETIPFKDGKTAKLSDKEKRIVRLFEALIFMGGPSMKGVYTYHANKQMLSAKNEKPITGKTGLANLGYMIINRMPKEIRVKLMEHDVKVGHYLDELSNIFVAGKTSGSDFHVKVFGLGHPKNKTTVQEAIDAIIKDAESEHGGVQGDMQEAYNEECNIENDDAFDEDLWAAAEATFENG